MNSIKTILFIALCLSLIIACSISSNEFVSGTMHFESGEYQKAIDDFSKAIESDPKLAEAYSIRGLSYSKLDEHEKAIEDYTKAIELKIAEEAIWYYHRAYSYEELREYQKAIDDYTKATESNPPFYMKDMMRWSLEKALEDYSKHINLNP